MNKDVTFLNRALLRSFLDQVDENSFLIIDGSKSRFIDHDILETIEDFLQSAPDDNIKVETRDLKGKEKIQYTSD